MEVLLSTVDVCGKLERRDPTGNPAIATGAAERPNRRQTSSGLTRYGFFATSDEATLVLSSHLANTKGEPEFVDHPAQCVLSDAVRKPEPGLPTLDRR